AVRLARLGLVLLATARVGLLASVEQARFDRFRLELPRIERGVRRTREQRFERGALRARALELVRDARLRAQQLVIAIEVRLGVLDPALLRIECELALRALG